MGSLLFRNRLDPNLPTTIVAGVGRLGVAGVSPTVSIGGSSTAFRYVRQGATGSGTGLDWTNAYTQLTTAEAAATRGMTIYVADTDSTSLLATTCDVPTVGTQTITIKKATIADHGTNTGWSDTYGDGQARIARLTINSSYWIIDGVTGSGLSTLPPDETPSNYGFYITQTTNGTIRVGRDANATNVTIKHCYMLSVTSDVDFKYAIWVSEQDAVRNNTNNLRVSHCLTDGFTNAVNYGNVNTDTIWEYNVHLNNYSSGSFHGEDFNASAGHAVVTTPIIRYNLFKFSRGTGTIAANNAEIVSPQIYGNVFDRKLQATNGIVTGTSAGTMIDPLIYNNTFIQGSTYSVGDNVDDGIFTNNLIYNMTAAKNSSPITSTYQWYASTTNTPSAGTEPTRQVSTGDPMVDFVNGDYRLQANSTAGDSGVSSVVAVDALGVPYNVSGAWSRGAFAYVP